MANFKKRISAKCIDVDQENTLQTSDPDSHIILESDIARIEIFVCYYNKDNDFSNAIYNSKGNVWNINLDIPYRDQQDIINNEIEYHQNKLKILLQQKENTKKS